MEKNNNIISSFQIATLTFFLTCGIFLGPGIFTIFDLIKRDTWLSVLISIIILILPIFLLLYIVNYQPEKNIFEKNKILFGKWGGILINFILTVFAFFIVLIILWDTCCFAITVYLTKTPDYFISGMFALAALYAVTKGIESISRVSEILFYLTLIILLFIVPTLALQFNVDYLKPFLKDGLNPVINASFAFTAFFITPFILLLVIPKNKVKDKEKYTKYFLIGTILGFILMFLIFFIIPGVITPEVSSLYVYPAFFVQRKISVGGVLNNVENIFSMHFYFNALIILSLGLYFLKKYFDHQFNIRDNKKSFFILIITIIAIILIKIQIFPNVYTNINFLKYFFTPYFALPLLILILIICIMIFIKKRKILK